MNHLFKHLFRFLIAVFALLWAAVPTAAQEITPEVTTPPLTETFTSDDERLTIEYPGGWLPPDYSANDYDASMRIANRSSAWEYFMASTDVFEAGDVVLHVYLTSKRELQAKHASIAPDSDMIEFLRLTRLPLLSPLEADYSTTTFNDLPAAEVYFNYPNYVDAYGLAFEVSEDVVGVMALYTFPGEVEQWKPTALAIAESINYTAPEATEDTTELTEIYTTRNGLFTFNYPHRWAIATQNLLDPGMNVALANRYDRLYANMATDFAPGDLQVVVVVWYQTVLNSINVHDSTELLQYLTDPGLSADSIASSDIEAITVDGWSGAQVYVQPPGNQEGWFLAFPIHEQIYATVALHTAPGELGQWQPTALAIAESIEFLS
jgi:hypothetical protein